ncbi:MAG: hypothetical protein JRD89_10465 [Deltaproteobacteria bacterium]|nr:hypothetical protein [Deltaproteobacteria bacterium]
MLRKWFSQDNAVRSGAKVRAKGPGERLKLATSQKREGNLDQAIESLRAAYAEIAKGQTTYTVDTYLRLPLYLQAAGRNDEAWSEFNRLLNDGYPNQLSDFSVQTMEHSEIYNKMRLFLQREGKNDKAVVIGVLSSLARARGLHLQRRKKEYSQFISNSEFESTLTPLLKKAHKMQCMPQMVEIMKQAASNPSDMNFADVSKRIGEILEQSSSA